MGLDNLSVRQAGHVNKLYVKINSSVHKRTILKSKDAKVRFFIKSEIHDVFGYRKDWRGYWVGKKHKIDEIYLPDPIGQLTILSNRK